MNYQIRKSRERPYFDHGWLKTYHTFSFAEYYDPRFMGFRNLRVINEDRVAPTRGFDPHPHRDMEIISVILEGELSHQDSMGTGSTIHAGEVQVMSAGSGIVHSEYNPSSTHPVHLLQIWILPDTKGITPRYQHIRGVSIFSKEWQLLASKEGRENSLPIQQDVSLYSLMLESGKQLEKQTPSHRYAWLQVIEGMLQLNGDILEPGDGVAIMPDTPIRLQALALSKALFFDLN